MHADMPKPDEAMFVGPLGAMVNELDEFTEGSRVSVLTSLLAGMSAAVGNLPQVSSAKGAMPLTFWPVLIGPTGVGCKGTATGIAMKVVEAGLGNFFQSSVSYTLPATGLGFAESLAEHSIRDVAMPVLYVEEEMDTFISNARRDTKIGSYFRKAWDGSTIGHKTSQIDLQIKKPHVAVIGHVQPKNWAAISGSRDATGGTYNRFFPVWSFQSKKLPLFAGGRPNELIEKLGHRFRQMVNFGQEVTDITVAPKVAETFEKKHRQICDAMTTGTEELGQYAERAMAYMVRIAGLYALADKRTEVKVKDFDAALALVSYMIETVTYVLPEASTSGNDIPARILAFVRDAGESGVTSTEIARAFQRVRAAEIRSIAEACEQIEIRKLKSEGGRPTTLLTWVMEEGPASAEIVEDQDDEALFRLAG